MEIVIDGWRASILDWREVQNIPKDQLPPLTTQQKEVTQKLRIAEEDYARSALAGKRTQERLVTKTERFARLLERKLRAKTERVTVNRIRLSVWEDRYEIAITVQGKNLSFRVEESLVDDLLEGGSAQADQRVDEILDLVLNNRAA